MIIYIYLHVYLWFSASPYGALVLDTTAQDSCSHTILIKNEVTEYLTEEKIDNVVSFRSILRIREYTADMWLHVFLIVWK